MKRLSLIILLIYAFTGIQAQDMIISTSGEISEGKVLEITPALVKYTPKTSPDGPLISLAKTDVFVIQFADGTKYKMNEQEIPTQNQSAPAQNIRKEQSPVQVVSRTSQPYRQARYKPSAQAHMPYSASASNYSPLKQKLDSDKARLVFYRPWSFEGLWYSFWINANGRKLTKPKNGAYQVLDIIPGNIRLYSQGLSKKPKDYTFKAGETYYILCNIRQNFIFFHQELVFVTPEEALSTIPQLKLKY